MDRQSRSNHHPHRQRPIAAALGVALLVGACSAATSSPNQVPPSVPGSAERTVPPTAAIPSPASIPSPSASLSPSPSPVPGPSLGSLALRWQKGGPVTGPKPSTWWPAVDPKTGNIWVSAAYEDKFWILSSAGKYLGSWGTPGSGPGQIKLTDNAPHPDPLGTIAFRPDGGFYIGDVGNYRIEQFDAKRQFVRSWGTFGSGDSQFSQVDGIVTDGTTIYAVDGDRNDVQVFDAQGKFLRTIGGSDTLPAFAALDKSGNLYVSFGGGGTDGGIIKYDPTGKEISRFPYPVAGDPQGVAVDPSGNVFLTVADPTPPGQSLGTWELAPDGHVLRGWTMGGESLALSADGGTIYYAREAIDGTGWPDVRAYAIPKS